MIKIVLTALTAFIGTNIDDIVMLTILFAAADSSKAKRNIVLGQIAGFSVAVVISIFGAHFAKMIPNGYIRFLGMIPIAIAIKK